MCTGLIRHFKFEAPTGLEGCVGSIGTGAHAHTAEFCFRQQTVWNSSSNDFLRYRSQVTGTHRYRSDSAKLPPSALLGKRNHLYCEFVRWWDVLALPALPTFPGCAYHHNAVLNPLALIDTLPPYLPLTKTFTGWLFFLLCWCCWPAQYAEGNRRASRILVVISPWFFDHHTFALRLTGFKPYLVEMSSGFDEHIQAPCRSGLVFTVSSLFRWFQYQMESLPSSIGTR